MPVAADQSILAAVAFSSGAIVAYAVAKWRENTLGAIREAPFYAVEISSGLLGTNGGPRTDGQARILGHDGAPIPGLLGAGNAIACPTGGIYAGAGGTLGPALTFGYIAGRTAALANT